MEKKRIKRKARAMISITVLCTILVLVFHIFHVHSASAATQQEKVTVAIISEPSTLDPTSTTHPPTTEVVSRNILERLLDLSPDGKAIPGLAESWNVSDDGKAIDFTLRKGVKFHSGDLLTAKDVVFSFERTKASTGTRALQSVERVEAIDDYHIKFHLSSPDANIIPNLGVFSISSKSFHDRVGEDKFVRNPPGTGPYRLVEWRLGEYIELEAYEDYWGVKPQVKRARINFIKEATTRSAMVRSGEADLIMDVAYSMVKELERYGFKMVKCPAMPTVSIQFHNSNPTVPWFNQKVRLAIAYAIDRDAIVDNLFQGIPARYAALAPWELGYDPELKPYPYDPEKAKQLLAETGYPGGFEMPLIYNIGVGYGLKETAEAVSLYLNAIGIKTKLEGMEIVKFVDKVRNDWHGNPNAVYVGCVNPPLSHYPDPTSPLDTFYTSTSPFSTYSNPEFDKMVLEAKRTMVDRKRGELVKKAIRILYDDVGIIPIWHNISVYAMKPDLDFLPVKGSSTALMLIKNIRINK